MPNEEYLSSTSNFLLTRGLVSCKQEIAAIMAKSMTRKEVESILKVDLVHRLVGSEMVDRLATTTYQIKKPSGNSPSSEDLEFMVATMDLVILSAKEANVILAEIDYYRRRLGYATDISLVDNYDVFPPGKTPENFGCHGYFESYCGCSADECVSCWETMKDRPEFSKQKEV